jgi:hypothetical protein
MDLPDNNTRHAPNSPAESNSTARSELIFMALLFYNITEIENKSLERSYCVIDY